MTKLLEQAIAEIRKLPEQRQNEAAEILLCLVTHDPDSIQLTAEQQAEVARQLEAPARYASDEEVAALFKKRGA